jgi:hypothetical protein
MPNVSLHLNSHIFYKKIKLKINAPLNESK